MRLILLLSLVCPIWACSITTASPLPNGTKGAPYSLTLASDCVAPVLWSVDSGSLPSGISLDGVTGIISGTGPASGTSTFVIAAIGNDHVSATPKSFDLSILCVITTLSLPFGTVGTAYSQTLATNCVSPGWFVVAGSLPAGLSLGSVSGVISGTPTDPGSSTFTVQAQQIIINDTELPTQPLAIVIVVPGTVRQPSKSRSGPGSISH